jgi:hypothetical protein
MSSERDLDAGLIALLEADVVRPVIFIYADFPSGVRRVWTGIGTVTFQGESWTGVGGVISLESIPESVDSGSQGITLTLNGLDQTVIDAMTDDEYQGRDVVMYLSFWDATRTTIWEPDANPDIPALPGGLQAETTAWITAAGVAGGGTISDDSKAIADKLIVLLKAESFYSKIVYLMPHLGPDLATAVTPLINTGAWAAPSVTGFVEADYDEATGIQGAGTTATKYINLHFGPADIEATIPLGGFGIWALWINNYDYDNVAWSSPVGSANTDIGADARRFRMELKQGLQRIQWGRTSGAAEITEAKADPGHWYGQRWQQDNRNLFKEGIELVDLSTTDTTGPAGLQDFSYMADMGNDDPTYSRQPWAGRSGLGYFTDGTMSDAEVLAFHDIVSENLIYMTGRLTRVFDPLWTGFLDTVTFEHGGVDGNSITFNLEHRLVDILRVREWRYTHRDQELLYPAAADTGMSKIEKIQDTSIPWGRTTA